METSAVKSTSLPPTEEDSVKSELSTPTTKSRTASHPTPQTEQAQVTNGHRSPPGTPMDGVFRPDADDARRPSEEDAPATAEDAGLAPADESLDRKRKRDQQEQPQHATPAEAEDDGAAAEAGTDGSERYTHVTVDNKTSKRLKVVSYKEFRDRTNGIKPTRTNKRRVPADLSELPAKLWHRIFTFCPPTALARIAQVNKRFHAYVSSSPTVEVKLPPAGLDDLFEILEPEAIWAASRQLFHPDMPKPLQGWSELNMWRLLAGKVCQFCGKTADSGGHAQAEYPGARELGDKGVAVIWAFGLRSCAACLLKNAEKEIDILISSTVPSSLLAALPFIFLTAQNNLVTASALQVATPPPTVQIIKYFSTRDLDAIKARFEEVKQLGTAATEEWFKGLSAEGSRRTTDIARWERWDYQGGLSSVLATLYHSDQTPPEYAMTPKGVSRVGARGDFTASRSNSGSEEDGNAARRQRRVQGPHRSLQNTSSSNQSRLERTVHQVNELKAARRQEIERRCLELDPPIEPNVLNHMESFQNALLISTPLNEDAWAVLKPRLLNQREAAEQKEAERIAQNRVLQAKYEQRRQHEVQLKEEKEALDREWDEAQAPIRELLGKYADEVIDEKWTGGKAITNDTSPKFAADVLIYVRQRFYRRIADEDSEARRDGREVQRDAPNAPPTRKLILENMKWVFDTKIKRYTEQFRKELFLCHVCDNSKFYGFEGVVQHFAAKHTSTLSQGSVVVHWRAEWPEYPPFHPDPSAAKAAFYAVPAPGAMGGHIHSGGPMHPGYGHPRYAQSPAPHGHSGFPPYTPTPYASAQYNQAYPGQPHHGPFAPPPPYQAPPSYPGPQPAGYHRDHPADYQGGPSGYPGPPPAAGYQGPSAGYHGAYHGHPGQGSHSFGSPYPAHSYPVPPPDAGPPGPQAYGPPPPNAYGAPMGPGPAHHPSEAHPPSGPTAAGPPNGSGHVTSGMYRTQLDYLASCARELWFSTSGVKDLPGGVRIYVVIYHVVHRFKERFSNEPSLAMFSDGLANHVAMKPVRNVNGLACKACISGNGSGVSHAGDRRLYTLPALLGHFQNIHIDRARSQTILPNGTAVPRLDWKIDMVELPERSVISSLMSALGMDDHKLSLIAEAFPSAFPWPLPVLGRASNSGPVPVIRDTGPSPRNAGTGRWTHPDSGYSDAPTGPRAGSSHMAVDYQEPVINSRNAPPRSASRSHRGPGGLRTRGAAEWEPQDREFAVPHNTRGPPRYPTDRVVLESEGPHRSPRPPRSPYYTEHDEDDARGAKASMALRSRYARSGDPRAEADDLGPPHPPSTSQVARHHRDRRGSAHDYEVKIKEDLDAAPPAAAVVGDFRESSSAARNLAASHPRKALPDGKPAVGEGSEDGEVGDVTGHHKAETRKKTPIESLSAAERFLNEFLPGEDTEASRKKASEHDRGSEHGTVAKPLNGQDADAQEQAMRVAGSEGALDRRDVARVPSGRRTPQEAAVNLLKPEVADDDQAPSSARGPRPGPPREYQADIYTRSPSRMAEGFEQGSGTGPRYISNPVMYHDERHTVDPLRRPRSRYDRYGTITRGKSRARSRSPPRHYHHAGEHLHYRTSPTTAEPRYEPAYRPRSPVPVYEERYPAEGGSRYSNAAHVTRYRSYTDDPRGYASSYAVPMDLVPVRRVSARSPPPGAVVIESPSQVGTYTRYPAYEDEYSRPEYDSRAPVYRVDRTIYHGEISRRPPHHHHGY